MITFTHLTRVGLAVAIITTAAGTAEARGRAWGHSFNGPYGGHVNSVGGGFRNANAGLGGGAWNATGPNGGRAAAAGMGGWKRGKGGFENTVGTATGPQGSTYNGYTSGRYNAQTGQGSYNASHQAYDARNGQTYGDTNHTTYNNGQGVTQLDTDHHGDYTVDWGKGQTPTVVKDSN